MTYDRASGALMERFKKLMAIVQPNDKGDNGPDEDDGGRGRRRQACRQGALLGHGGA